MKGSAIKQANKTHPSAMEPTTTPGGKPYSTNDHLCCICNGILIRPYERNHTSEKFAGRSGADVAKSIEAGCRLCTMLGEILKIRHLTLSLAKMEITPRLVTLDGEITQPDLNQGIGTTEKYRRIIYLLQIENKGIETVEIALVPKDDKSLMFREYPDYPLPLSTNSNSSFEFIKRCSSFCRKFHEICNSNRGSDIWLPTRLIDVGDTDSQRPRVVVTASEHIGNCEYVCLTHRWIGVTLKLESTNIDELRKEIPMEKISQTFRDAFTTTRQLGFRYIWADSLCIMQDQQFQEGLQDWLTESERMGENYKHAALTIAPTPTVDNVDVFFSNRDTSHRTPLAINIKRKAPIGMNLIRCGKTEIDISGQYYCFSKDIWLSQVDRAPLNHRGWVYQERLLSPRTVHFATEIFWECRLRIASEMLPIGFPYDEGGLPPNTKFWRGKKYGTSKFLDQYGKWMEFVENFSHCHLTMERDKLPAIAGVAAVFEFSNDQYLAGLWRGGLASQLIWRRSEKRWANYEPPLNYRAPSWSWASVNGPVEFLADTFYIDRRSRYTAAIIDSKVDLLVVKHPFGQVTGAQLCLRADLAHISPQRIAQNPEWMLTLDDNKEYMRVVTYYLCVFTAHVSWCNDLFLLVLEPTGAKSEEFRRIGVLMIRLGNDIPVEGFKVFPDCTITII